MNSLQFALHVIKRVTLNPELTLTECRNLLLIANGQNTTAEMMECTNSTQRTLFGKACRNLVAKGYIEIVKSVANKHYYALTPAGIEQLKHILSTQ